jgi:hypothetical protein
MATTDLFQKNNELASDLLLNHRGKIVAIRKATRAGATTSLLKVAVEKRQKTVIVLPFHNIFNQTVNEALKLVNNRFSPRVAEIKANKYMCQKTAKELEKYPQLEELGFSNRGNCKSCRYKVKCEFQSVLQDEWDVLGLTYQKLDALMRSKRKTDKALIRKIQEYDNFIFDELAQGLGKLSEVKIPNGLKLKDWLNKEFELDKKAEIPFEREYPSFWVCIKAFAEKIDSECQDLASGKPKIIESPFNTEEIFDIRENFASFRKTIAKEAKESKDKDFELLGKIISILGETKILAQKAKEKNADGKRNGEITLFGLKERDWFFALSSAGFIGKFIYSLSTHEGNAESFFELQREKPRATLPKIEGKFVALIDVCYPFKPDDVIGAHYIPFEYFSWGDPLETNKTQLILCDTRKIDKISFFKDGGRILQPQLKKTIRAITKLHGAEKIMLVSMSSDINNVIKQWQENGEIDKLTKVTYHRSDISRGVTPDKNRNFMILIGGPYIPQKSFLPSSADSRCYFGIDDETTIEISDRCRDWNQQSNFLNMIGRVKDSNGEKPSIVYALGSTYQQVSGWVAVDEVPSPQVVEFPVNGVNSEDFKIAGELWLKYPRNSWISASDIAFLAQMINNVPEGGRVSLSKIMQTCGTKEKHTLAKKYGAILNSYRITVIDSAGGAVLEKEGKGFRAS